MYTEFGRTCVVGKASQEIKDEFAFALEARKFNLGLLKPGTSCKDIFAAYNDFMRRNGRPEEKRLHCHGQGYDMVERPLIRNDEPMMIEKDMNIVVHPTYIRGHVFSWVCDNYLIEASGPSGRLHRFPRNHHRTWVTASPSRSPTRLNSVQQNQKGGDLNTIVTSSGFQRIAAIDRHKEPDQRKRRNAQALRGGDGARGLQ